MLINLLVILVVGGPGNLLTAVAIPYVRNQFNQNLFFVVDHDSTGTLHKESAQSQCFC
jgi:hypothetical protein